MTELTAEEVSQLRVSLKDHFESRIRALEKATDLAAANMNTRLEGMNEFRAQLKTQEQTFLTRAEHSTLVQQVGRLENVAITRTEHNTLCEQVAGLANVISKMEGKASTSSVFIAYGISFFSILVAAILHFIK